MTFFTDKEKIVMNKKINKLFDEKFELILSKGENEKKTKGLLRTLWKKSFVKHGSKGVANKAIENFVKDFL